MARAGFQRRYLLATWTCRPSDTIQIHRSHEQWLTCCGDVAAFLEPAGRAEISVQYPQIEGALMMYVLHELEIQRRETLDAMRASWLAGVVLEINLVRIRAATSARIAARLPSFSAMRCNDRRALWNK
jgi:hypothetical protein